jgi:hypothetical protein
LRGQLQTAAVGNCTTRKSLVRDLLRGGNGE